MATCASCGTVILFGGSTHEGKRYCNDRCVAAGGIKQAASAIPEDLVLAEATNLHRGPCPICRGPGPVDIHRAHQVLSFIIFTRHTSTPVLSCRPCARGRQGSALALTLLGGWWGFPWGLIFTPIFAIRNLAAMAGGGGGPKDAAPSAELRSIARVKLGMELRELEARPGREPEHSGP